jgi:hypothetical protein
MVVNQAIFRRFIPLKTAFFGVAGLAALILKVGCTKPSSLMFALLTLALF